MVIAGNTSAYVVTNTTTAAIPLTNLVKNLRVLRSFSICLIFLSNAFIIIALSLEEVTSAAAISICKKNTC